MSSKIADQYNQWAPNYDTQENKTRDLEKMAGQQMIGTRKFRSVLELGCGTGKNTEWLSGQAEHLTGLDFSREMLDRARMKIKANNVNFLEADMLVPWPIVDGSVELVTSSLVLEHVEDLESVFQKAHGVLENGGWFYVCELHPFKQYDGTKARFIRGNDKVELDVFIHHVSDYVGAARNAGFQTTELREWFDEDDSGNLPRLISFLFKKPT